MSYRHHQPHQGDTIARLAAWKRRAHDAVLASGDASDAFAWASAEAAWYRALILADGSIDLALTYPVDL